MATKYFLTVLCLYSVECTLSKCVAFKHLLCQNLVQEFLLCKFIPCKVHVEYQNHIFLRYTQLRGGGVDFPGGLKYLEPESSQKKTTNCNTNYLNDDSQSEIPKVTERPWRPLDPHFVELSKSQVIFNPEMASGYNECFQVG
jgi:hypothetical protein